MASFHSLCARPPPHKSHRRLPNNARQHVDLARAVFGTQPCLNCRRRIDVDDALTSKRKWVRQRPELSRKFSVNASLAASQSTSKVEAANELLQWLISVGYPPLPSLNLKGTDEPHGVKVVASKQLSQGDVLFNIPENFAVTAVDVSTHPVLSLATAEESSDLALLALWLLWESSQGNASPWAPYIRTFSPPPLSPLLWTKDERERLLRGYSGLPVIEERIEEIEGLYSKLKRSLFTKDPESFPEAKFSKQQFKEAFVSVLSRAIFLPGVDIFALIPIADLVRHSPSSKAFFQYSPEEQAVKLISDMPIAAGAEVFACQTPELSNFDLALRSGEVFPGNPWDVVSQPAFLVATDPLFIIKKQLLQEEGFGEAELFPLYANRFPRQLLSYLRLARLQDAAQFPKVTFKSDTIVSDANEYEVLMLLLGECKERLNVYPQTLEDDLRLLNLGPERQRASALFGMRGARSEEDDEAVRLTEKKERLAAQLRASEKQILSNTVTALRNRLAPIRGIPTKSGMGDPNAEIKEVFGLMEKGLSAPKKLLGDFFGKQ